MCGRYVNVASDSDLTSEFDIEDVLDEDPGRSWNVAPTDPVRIVVQRAPRHGGPSESVRQLRTARWGLVPSWSRDRKGGARMINARIETVTQKPAFKSAAARRRCLIPALGYYEWQRTDTGKIPHFLHDPDGGLLAMAGLYELWPDPALPDGDPHRWLWTCTIITQQASDLLGAIHDRNPVVIPPDLRTRWLDCSSGDAAAASQLLGRVPEARLEPYVVSAAVGNVKNNGPELIEPLDISSPQPIPALVGQDVRRDELGGAASLSSATRQGLAAGIEVPHQPGAPANCPGRRNVAHHRTVARPRHGADG